MKNLLFLKIWRAYALHTKMSILFAELFCIYKFGIIEKNTYKYQLLIVC